MLTLPEKQPFRPLQQTRGDAVPGLLRRAVEPLNAGSNGGGTSMLSLRQAVSVYVWY